MSGRAGGLGDLHFVTQGCLMGSSAGLEEHQGHGEQQGEHGGVVTSFTSYLGQQ